VTIGQQYKSPEKDVNCYLGI